MSHPTPLPHPHHHQQPSPTHPPFYFNHTPTPNIYPLSLHDALPISLRQLHQNTFLHYRNPPSILGPHQPTGHFQECNSSGDRSEEHTSELQSQSNLVCRLLLEKKKTVRVLAARDLKRARRASQ